MRRSLEAEQLEDTQLRGADSNGIEVPANGDVGSIPEAAPDGAPSSSRVCVGQAQSSTEGAPLDSNPNDRPRATLETHPPMVVGQVLDTHHPLMPGRVMVAWVDAAGQRSEGWLERERHLSLSIGDQVLLSWIFALQEWVVTGALGRKPESPAPDPDNERQLRLQPGESVSIIAHDGQPMLTLRQGPSGPVIELGAGDVDLKAARTLRLSGESIEVRAAEDIDLRSDRDTLVRGRFIRLN